MCRTREKNFACGKFCKFILLAVTVAAGVWNSEAKNIYVNSANYGVSGIDGTSVAKGFGTIQDGVDAALEGDTVLVAPGVYDKGGKTFDWGAVVCSNRVLISKPITLKAISSNPVDTVIKGSWDSNPTSGNAFGIGPAAVRCVKVTSADVVVKGFTLADGSCQALTAEGDIQAGHVGGFAGYNNANKATVFAVDCVITNCAGARGGAVRYATCVRCVIEDCKTQGGQAGARHVQAFHTVFCRNSSAGSECIGESKLINCAIIETRGNRGCASGAVDYRNSLVYANDTAPNQLTAEYYAWNSAFQTLGNVDKQTDCLSGEIFAFVAPLRGDYRVRKDSPAATLGSAAVLRDAVETLCSGVPEEVEIYKSLDGVAIDAASSASIAAGPYQKTVETFGGQLFVDAKGAMGFVADGGSGVLRNNSYAFATEYPSILAVTINAEVPIHRIDRADEHGGNWYPDMKNRALCGFPPAGIVVTNNVYCANKVVYVNPNGVDDDAEEGRGASADKPFRTLQYAMDRLSLRDVLIAAEGVYAEGGKLSSSVSNRLVSTSHVRVVGAGAGKSFIMGAGDENDPAGDRSKRGPQAMRCVDISSGECAIQGFTLSGGRSGYNADKPTNDIDINRGGCIKAYPSDGKSQKQHILDCAITDGLAFRGGLAFGGHYERCVFTGSKSLGGGLIRENISLNGCVIHGNTSGSTIDSSSAYVYQSTAVGHTDNVIATSVQVKLQNSIVVAKGSALKPGSVSGTVLCGFGTINSSVAETLDYTTSDPVFVDASDGDYRIGSASPAVACGTVPDDWWMRPVCDFNGNPLRFVNGKCVAGAFADPVAMVRVDGIGDVSVSHNDVQFVEPGESITFTATKGFRPFKGFIIDGETLVEGSASYTFTAPSESSLTSIVSIVASPITDFYVNANDGDDANDGFSAATPKRTLAGVMSISGLGSVKGDTVHAAAGTYDTLAMPSSFTNTAPNTILSRVCVPMGVTLAADEGPEVTIIEGASASESDSNGFGADAVRCASVRKNAVLRGFTLRNGRCANKETSEKDDYVGGGVLTENASGYPEDEFPRLENCVLTGNSAARGGAGCGKYGVYVNCRFTGNKATATSSAFFRGIAYGCYFDANIGDQLCRYATKLINCTVTDGNLKLNGTDEMANPIPDFGTGCPDGVSPVINGCIFLCQINSAYVTNSIVVKERYGANTATEANIVVESIQSVKLTDGVPAKDSPAVDVLEAEGVSEFFCGVDAANSQRVYNGRLDLGAFEYDWRGDYAVRIGGKPSVVTVASPNLVESIDGKTLVLKEGDFSLVLEGGDTKANTKYTLPFEVTGEGVLTVILNGNVYGTFKRGIAEIMFKNALASNELVFSYDAFDAGVSFGVFERKKNAFVFVVR